jgi:hypothetical protein
MIAKGSAQSLPRELKIPFAESDFIKSVLFI